jgi:hypothetical protein
MWLAFVFLGLETERQAGDLSGFGKDRGFSSGAVCCIRFGNSVRIGRRDGE